MTARRSSSNVMPLRLKAGAPSGRCQPRSMDLLMCILLLVAGCDSAKDREALARAMALVDACRKELGAARAELAQVNSDARQAEEEARAARESLSPLARLLGDDLSSIRARQMEGFVLLSMRTHYFDIEQTIGREILDDSGNIVDPVDVLRRLDKSARRRGLSAKQRRLAFRDMFGPESGSRIAAAIERETP